MDVRKILAQAHFEKVRAERTVGLMRAGWVEAGQRAEEQVVADAIAAEVTRAVAEEREACAIVAHQMFPPCKSHAAGECPNPPQKWTAGTAIAAAIRARGTKKEER